MIKKLMKYLDKLNKEFKKSYIKKKIVHLKQ